MEAQRQRQNVVEHVAEAAFYLEIVLADRFARVDSFHEQTARRVARAVLRRRC